MVRRPIALDELVERYEPSCTRLTGTRTAQENANGRPGQEMHGRGYPEWETSLTLKPFTLGQLYDGEGPNLAICHPLNLVFSATPVLGEAEFESVLDDLLATPQIIQGALLGRIVSRAILLTGHGESPLQAWLDRLTRSPLYLNLTPFHTGRSPRGNRGINAC